MVYKNFYHENKSINNFLPIDCIKCIEKPKKNKLNCEKCKAKEILDNLTIINKEDTLNELIYNNKSISRFGDGEFNLLLGSDLRFQKNDKILSKKLNETLHSNEKNLIIGIPDSIKLSFLHNFRNVSERFWLNYIEKNKFKLLRILNINKTYYSAFITRFYMDWKDKSTVSVYIKKLKKLWDKKEIMLIEGEKSRLGVDNDLFDNAKSIQRIICPAENAFKIYQKILKETLKINKKKLVLIALGPTATVLAYDLYKEGYHVIDIGHVDIEYEWFLSKTPRKLRIKNKNVLELKGGKTNVNYLDNKEYNAQIIKKILK